MDQNLHSVLAPIFDLGSLYQVLEEHTDQQQDTRWGGYAFLLNNDGNFISHPDTEEIFHANYFQQEGISKGTVNDLIDQRGMVNVEGGEVHSFSRIETFSGFNNEWYVGVAVDGEELYAPLRNLLMQYLVFFSIMLIVITLAVYKLSQYLVLPIQQLVETTKNLAEGNKKNQKYVSAYEEVNYLNATFDHMTEQLEEREKKNKKSTVVLESTDSGVLAINRKTKKITLFNRKCEMTFLLSKEQAIGVELDILIEQSPTMRNIVEKGNIHQLSERGEVKDKYEIDFISEDTGEMQTYLLSITSLPGPDSEAHDEMLIIFNDLTEKRKMELELVRSERLKVVGEMAAGFAHEIKNPLTTIKGFIQLFNERDNSRNEQFYELVGDEIDRVNKLMNELLELSNPNSIKKFETIDIEKLLNNCLTLHQSDMNDNHIELEVFFEKDLPEPLADRNKLQQVFMNLFNNAIQAIPDGGNLIIRSSLDDQREQIVVSVKDSGSGMSCETLQKLGTPFFTTKESGTGLGLTTSYRIIEEMGGTITVQSIEQGGTTFTVYIPLEMK
ncbi:ATP-binding protein [Salipaludibacillus sp. CF4.18]|uniref:ATP-binding protein n=1 Tax=Salipaludibacillus sp. CF4.18 TaxID=3373081 RepID=UPI003EE7F0E4